MELTASCLIRAVQADAPVLLLIAVDPSAVSDGMGLPCRVLGTLGTSALPLPADAPPPAVPPPVAEPALIARMLTATGIPTNLLGYAYLRTALTLMLRKPETGRGLMHTLYPEVARQHGTTARCVERAIRHAIAQAWARGGGAEYSRLLGRLSSTVGDRPTNSEFLAQMAEGIRMELSKAG